MPPANVLAPAIVLYGRDGFRAACVEHDWLSPTLRSTFAVAATDALVHLKTEHESKPR